MLHGSQAHEKLLKVAKERFRLASEAEARQREREREDLRFQVGEYQWDEDARVQRRGGIVGGQVVPARPMLSISLLAQPLQLIQNQASQAHLGVEIHPVSEEAETEVAEIKQGLYRRIERDSNANQARLWALDRAKQCGRGWYRVNTKWDEDGDSPLDQEIVIERILNQDSVYADPSAQQPDCSDARWAMITAWVPVETFREDYPEAQVPTSDTEFKSWMREDPNWIMSEGEHRAVLVVEYFEKIFDHEEINIGRQKRTAERVRVRYAKLTAREVLEEQDWNGKYIPIIPVLGRELQPFDGERRFEGVVRGARDGQKLFNYAASNLVERMALEPKAPFVMAEGQEEGHEDEWGQANTRNFPYLRYKPTSIGDQVNPPPQRAQIDASGMSLALMALQQGKQFVQSATSVYEPSLGEMPSQRESQSGRAIQALQQQSDAGTGHFLQSLAQVSMAYEARVVLDLMPKIYDRPGRVTQILGAEDEPKMVMLGRPFVPDQDGRPVAADSLPPGVRAPDPERVKAYDLGRGKYSVSVSVGKAYQTRLQEGQAEIGGVLQAAPQLMPLIGPTYFRFRDFPGAKELSELLKKERDRQFPHLAEGDEQSAERIKAELDQAKQQLEQMQQQLKAATEALGTEQAKQQAQVAKAQIDAGSKTAIAQLEQQTKLMLEEMRQRFAALESALERSHEERKMVQEQAHETGITAMKGPATPRGDMGLLGTDADL